LIICSDRSPRHRRALQAVRQATPSTINHQVSNARHRHTPAARQGRAGKGETYG
jgi:hypothetical protein